MLIQNKLVLAICFAVIATTCQPAFSQTKNSKTQAKPIAAPIKVMSFNIRYGSAKDGDNRWENRDHLVSETIRIFDPDLLGVQEALKFQTIFLRDEFPEYSFHGVGRNDGANKGEFVPVMFRTERFVLVDSGHFWLSETPEVVGSKSWDSSLPRMVSWVKLKDMQNKDAELAFLNTHFDHEGKTARLESARLIRANVQRFLGQGIPVIVAGDFNTTEGGQPYAALMEQTADETQALLDSFRQANPIPSEQESTFSAWNGRRKGARIDWILHSAQFSTIQSIINHTNDNGRYPSDHYPVQSIVRLNRN